MRRRGLLALGAAALGLALTGAALASLWRQPQPLLVEGTLETLADYGLVPDFRLTERGGSTMTLADLRGKIWLANGVLRVPPARGAARDAREEIRAPLLPVRRGGSPPRHIVN